MSREALLSDKRQRLLRAVRATYAELFEKSSTIYQLIAACDKALDCPETPLDDWGHLQQHCHPLPWVVQMYRCRNA